MRTNHPCTGYPGDQLTELIYTATFLKITAIKPILADAGYKVLVFVKIETNHPGLIGWGEASLEGKPQAVVGCIGDMAPMILEEDPRQVERCWQILYRSGFWRQGVIGMSVISAIDQALWDIKGKELGRPVYELLGGHVRDKVRAYTHFGGSSPDEIVESALSKVEEGWSAIKTVAVPPTKTVDSPILAKEAAATFALVREAVGNNVDLLIDCHGRLSPQMAIRYGKEFEPYSPFWMEEPSQAENPAAMAPVAAALEIPIATGERLFTRWGFREILEKKAACVLQPDTCHAGGISEVLRIASMAETYYAGLAPHNPYGPVSTAACLQVDLAAQNFVIQEVVDPAVAPEMMDFVKEPLVLNDGYFERPTTPGLGVEVDEAACARRKPDFSPESIRRQSINLYGGVYDDGGVADV